ncbi:NPC intracellular cholesterol transporter 1-like [Dendrobium catenatum]|uniref:NPC intracellular cholesterol transporter 1-like n=1 Tax=Dendrobium catenatum TaxID=906689 RepID=UPI0010A012E4|nr:NPC intracellular cholesterol transporter 1-like [Dendrobium catenatum]
MADPKRDHGFVYNHQGRVDVLISPFFDLNLEIDHIVDDYVDQILCTLETDIDEHQIPGQWRLWVGHGSKAAEEKRFFDYHLAPFYRIEQLVLATVPVSKNAMAPSIVTDQNMKLLFEIQKKVDTLHANYSGSMVSLADICLKPLADDCATQSVLQYFKMNQKRYDDYGGVQHAEYCFEHFSSEETCRSAFQAPLDPGTVLGGFSGSNYSDASAFIITYPVNNEAGDTGNQNGKAVAWERAFIRLVKEELVPLVEPQNLTLSFSSESSIQDELERESSADVVTILVSYLVMFAYISFAVGDSPQWPSFLVTSKVFLPLSSCLC